MRRFSAGIFIFLLLLPLVAFAQVRGEVESIGFKNTYRPDCWTPMTVKLVPETGKTEMYQIQVRQEDLDRDRPIFTRMVSVTGNSDGQTREQRFRVYFIPQTSGLPDSRDAGATLADLQEQLVVNICTESGKQIARLPVTSSVQNIDPRPGAWDSRRGTRFLLAVTEGRSQLVYLDQATATGLLGMVEDVAFVMVRPDELPENVIGYDAIDGIVWLNADPASLGGGGGEKRRALESYVARGGRLVICQTPEWQKTQQFGDLLPVTLQGVEESNKLEPLRSIALSQRSELADMRAVQQWGRVKGPFRIARAKAKPNAVIDQWGDWDDQTRSPYIARHVVGLGSVTWVAQDLADPSITGTARSGWPFVWERVFDWNNDPIPLTPQSSEREFPAYAGGLGVDMGHSLLSGMELPSKTAWLITLAIVFFIAYWVVAGPGVYFYLLTRRRAGLSWFGFAAAAMVAIGLTAVLVKLVLRGPPELKHFSVVRIAPNTPAWVHSRFGLYIPRDGFQEVELKETSPGSVSTISAFALPPAYLQSARDVRGPEYAVPVIEAASDQPAAVRFPYSSTLKKLQATWTGNIEGKVEGSASLRYIGYIEGQLTNGTKHRLRNVYIAFKYPEEAGAGGDWLLYLPTWDAGTTIDLKKEFFTRLEDNREAAPLVGMTPDIVPTRGRKVRGWIETSWAPYWYPSFKTGLMQDNRFDDSAQPVRRSLPMLSLFERLPPAKNDLSARGTDRFELLRRGGRYLDVSHVLAAGALVVLAEADGPLPMPLNVEGDPVTGSGTILYQFLLPLDRTKLYEEIAAQEEPATQPSDSGTEMTPERP